MRLSGLTSTLLPITNHLPNEAEEDVVSESPLYEGWQGFFTTFGWLLVGIVRMTT